MQILPYFANINYQVTIRTIHLLTNTEEDHCEMIERYYSNTTNLGIYNQASQNYGNKGVSREGVYIVPPVNCTKCLKMQISFKNQILFKKSCIRWIEELGERTGEHGCYIRWRYLYKRLLLLCVWFSVSHSAFKFKHHWNFQMRNMSN